MKWLVFSKNRAYQLDAFLSTAKENAGIDPSDISVLYKYDQEYKEDLVTVMTEHHACTFLQEEDFRSQVIEWCKNVNGLMSFATDDAIFTRTIDETKIQNVLGANPGISSFSLRMGLHLDYCYPLSVSQKVPDGQVLDGVFGWNFTNAEHDWAYPLSVDGHVFRSNDMLQMLEAIPFMNPNTLEANLQMLKSQILPIMCCFLKSCYINTPLNLVQNVYDNRHGKFDMGILQSNYRSGTRHISQTFRNFINISAHQELEI